MNDITTILTSAGYSVTKNIKNMIDFLPAKNKKDTVDLKQVELFIACFNRSIAENDFVINTGLDNCPELNQSELSLAKQQALKMGYVLTSFEYNYNTTSYKLEPH